MRDGAQVSIPAGVSARQVVEAFWHGATRPSLGAVILAVVINVAGVIAMVGFLKTWMMHGGDGYLALHPFDREMFVTSEAMTMAKMGGTQEPIVAILGGSSILALIDARSLEQQLHTRAQPPAVVYKFTTPRQSIWEMVALVDLIPKTARGIVVVEAGLSPYAYDHEYLAELVSNPHLGVRSDAFDDEVEAAGLTPARRFGNYFLDNYAFFVSRASTWLTRIHRVPMEMEPMPFLGPDTSPYVQRWGGGPYSERIVQYASCVEDNVAVLERIVERLKGTQLKLVLLDSPINPRFVADFNHEPMWREHRQRMHRFADDHGLLFWDVVNEAQITEGDYFDYAHLTSPEAVSRATGLLADHLMPLLAGDTTQGEAP